MKKVHKRIGALIMTLSLGMFSAKVSAESQLADWWKVSDLYQDDGWSVSLSGRLHGDLVWQESEYEENDWRRFRFGAKVKHSGVTYHLEGDFDLNNGGKYKQLTDANISWNLSPKTSIKVLKQSAGFTLDGATSSKKLLTPERNNIANNLWFTQEYFTGITLKGQATEAMNYQVGLFSNDGDPEFGFDAGAFVLGSIMYKPANTLWWDKAQWRVDYVINDIDEQSNTREFKQVYSVSSQLRKGLWGLDAEFAAGQGDAEQSDIWGLVVMPHKDVNEQWQVVARYTFMESKEGNGLRLNRYENKAIGGRGDRYQELFVGANYYIVEHKLKLQFGTQYVEMEDSLNDGGEASELGATAALRIYW